MTGRLPAIELPVQHVRNPGQGMPIAGIESLASPRHSWPGQPSLHMRIPSDILLVIVNQKFMGQRRREDCERDQAQGHANQAFKPPRARWFFHKQGLVNDRIIELEQHQSCSGHRQRLSLERFERGFKKDKARGGDGSSPQVCTVEQSCAGTSRPRPLLESALRWFKPSHFFLDLFGWANQARNQNHSLGNEATRHDTDFASPMV